MDKVRMVRARQEFLEPKMRTSHTLQKAFSKPAFNILKSRDLKQHGLPSFSGEYSCVGSERDRYMDFVVVVVLIEPTGSIYKQNKIGSKISK